MKSIAAHLRRKCGRLCLLGQSRATTSSFLRQVSCAYSTRIWQRRASRPWWESWRCVKTWPFATMLSSFCVISVSGTLSWWISTSPISPCVWRIQTRSSESRRSSCLPISCRFVWEWGLSVCPLIPSSIASGLREHVSSIGNVPLGSRIQK